MKAATGAFFDDTSELLEVFKADEVLNRGYYDPIPFTDRKVGFSIKREYPDNIRYKPPNNRKGEPDKIATIWITYLHPDEAARAGKGELNSQCIPITLRISTFSKYLANHFDYSDTDDESPTEAEVAASNRTPEPIPLDFRDEFFFNHEANCFIDQKGRRYSPRELMDHVYKLHCDTLHRVRGLWLRLRLSGKDWLVASLTLLADFLIWLLSKAFGRTIETSDRIGNYYRGYNLEDFKRLKEDSIDVFGYQAGRSTVIVFCLLLVLIGLSAYPDGYKTGLIAYISGSNTMLVATLILALAFLDLAVPPLVILLLNMVIKVRTYLMFKRMKVRT